MQADRPTGYNSVKIEGGTPKMMGLDATTQVRHAIQNGGSMPETVFKRIGEGAVDGSTVMKFKTASNNPHAMAVPLGRSWSEFPTTREGSINLRGAFQDKVDSRTIMKGDGATLTETGKSHT